MEPRNKNRIQPTMILNVNLIQEGDEVKVAGDSVNNKSTIQADSIGEVCLSDPQCEPIPLETSPTSDSNETPSSSFQDARKGEFAESQNGLTEKHENASSAPDCKLAADCGRTHFRGDGDIPNGSAPSPRCITNPKYIDDFEPAVIQNPRPVEHGELQPVGTVIEVPRRPKERRSFVTTSWRHYLVLGAILLILTIIAVASLALILQMKNSNEEVTEDFQQIEPIRWGGWTVIQRRMDGSVDFYRDWENYVVGFGRKDQEFWLGLEAIHRITSTGNYELRIDMTDIYGVEIYAAYGSFCVGNASSKYALSVSDYDAASTAGDSLTVYHDGRSFSARDSDNDEDDDQNCAAAFSGAWWYDDCYKSNLNGLYDGLRVDKEDRIQWLSWNKGSYSKPMTYVEMKIRPT